MRPRLLFSLIIAIVLLSGHIARGQGNSEIKQQGDSLSQKRSDEMLKFDSTLNAMDGFLDSIQEPVKKWDSKRSAWKASVAFSLQSDKTDDRDEPEINTELNIEKGQYPCQFRLKFYGKINKGNEDDFNEDISSLTVNYDYYLSPGCEVYWFMERFEDDYLKIDRRIEVGFGIKGEIRFGSNKSKEIKKMQNIENRERAIVKDGEYLYDALSKTQLEKYNKHQNTLKKVKYARIAAIKNDAIITISLALSFFHEFEKLQPIPFALDSNGKDIDTTFDSSKRYRLVLRPSLTIKPINHLTLFGLCYLKYPIFGHSKVGNTYDLRIDAHAGIKIHIMSDESGQERVSLVSEYRFHYDKAPPYIVLNSPDAFNNKKHETYNWKIVFEI